MNIPTTLESATSEHNSLFDPLKVGRYELNHRVVMAPLTRMRAGAAQVPGPLNAIYYAQRASTGGLIISEATQVSAAGQGYPDTPGIHTPEQIDGWRLVTEAVHALGGVVFLQIWHTGRVSHRAYQADGRAPGAPSAVRPEGDALLPDWSHSPYETPRVLELDEIAAIVADFGKGARNALEAGFDGVEIHGANGYLLQQFLESRTNQRTDGYGGPVQQRARILLEVTRAAVDVWGADRVGVRLSPFGDLSDHERLPLYTHVLDELSRIGLAYLHLVEPRVDGVAEVDGPRADTAELLRAMWPGTLIVAGGHSPDTAKAVSASRAATAVAFGRAFISNPDLPERIRRAASLNEYDRSTFYGGDEHGYTDYPTLDQQASQAA